MWFFVGVGFMVLGVAFCLLGTIRLPGGRLLRAIPAQACGVILLCYFPLLFALRMYIDALELEPVYIHLIHGGLAAICVLAVLFVILRTTQPPRPVRQLGPRASSDSPLLRDEPEASVTGGPGKPATPRHGSEKNPFDFS